MSHPSKLIFIKTAKEKGYKIYLYFIAPEDPDININRVSIRVAQDGHNVNRETISKRYFKSLENLKSAVQSTNRTYIFDNSGTVSKLVAEITEGINVHVIDPELTPNWFGKYLT